MKKKFMVAGTAAAAILVIVWGMGLFRKTEEEVTAVLPSVETTIPQRGSIYLNSYLTGTVEPEDVVRICPETDGTVTEVRVKAGDRVSEGQILCVIDTKQVETSRNALDTAALTLQEAQTELSRQQILYSGGDISRQEYENYANTAERAKLSYEKAKLDYDNQVSFSQVAAPIGGVVEDCEMEVFDKVNSSSQICVISGEGNKIISTGLTEHLKDAVAIGDKIQAEKNGGSYQGTVYEISSMADPSSGLYKMKSRMEEENSLSTGSVVKISFVTERAENVMTVPVDAVYYDNGSPYLYLFDEGVVHKAYAEVGIYDSEVIEICSGVESRDKVITTWSPELYEGAAVKLRAAIEGDAE